MYIYNTRWITPLEKRLMYAWKFTREEYEEYVKGQCLLLNNDRFIKIIKNKINEVNTIKFEDKDKAKKSSEFLKSLK
jgi:hypothetical protein